MKVEKIREARALVKVQMSAAQLRALTDLFHSNKLPIGGGLEDVAFAIKQAEQLNAYSTTVAEFSITLDLKSYERFKVLVEEQAKVLEEAAKVFSDMTDELGTIEATPDVIIPTGKEGLSVQATANVEIPTGKEAISTGQ